MLHLPTLTTERLCLRPFTLADAAQIHALASNYDIARFTSNIPHPYEEGYAERWIATHAHQFYTNQHVTLAVTDLANGTIFGTVSLSSHRANKRAELGYWVGVPYWGNGYCTEAAQALIHYGFEVLDLHKIGARHFVSNPASGRVMQKMGMQHEAVLREEVLKDGVYHDMAVYGLINPAHSQQQAPSKTTDHKTMKNNTIIELLTAYTPLDATEQQHHARTLAFVTQTLACTQRTTLQGHITASAWILSPDGDAALLTHHKKLNLWIQLGGHIDPEDTSIQAAALREAHEESGIAGLRLLDTALFDLDVHPIPAKGDEPAHYHYDFRFLMQAPTTAFTISDESHHLAWVQLTALTNTDSASLNRMARKTHDHH